MAVSSFLLLGPGLPPPWAVIGWTPWLFSGPRFLLGPDVVAAAWAGWPTRCSINFLFSRSRLLRLRPFSGGEEVCIGVVGCDAVLINCAEAGLFDVGLVLSSCVSSEWALLAAEEEDARMGVVGCDAASTSGAEATSLFSMRWSIPRFGGSRKAPKKLTSESKDGYLRILFAYCQNAMLS